jgi:hypothetical protein
MMTEHKLLTASRSRHEIWIRALMVTVLLLGALLLWHDLDEHEVLGRDENATIIKLDQPSLVAVAHASGVKANGQPSSMQPLYFLLQHLVWPLVDHSAFLLRFLPSAFALLGIVFTFKLGEALWSSTVGLLGGLLVAVLPLHVEYGQIIRPYSLLALLSLASAYFLVVALRSDRPVYWLGFAIASSLNIYTHFNALFVLAAEGVFAATFWLKSLVKLLRQQESQGPLPRLEWAKRLAFPALSFALVGLLCIPAIVRLVELRWVGPGSGSVAGEVTVQLTTAFFYRYLYKIGLTSAWLRGLILGLMALGLAITLYRRRWQAALLSILWLAMPFLALSAIKSPRPFAERYVIFVPPIAFLLVGQGMAGIGQAAGSLGRRWNARKIEYATIAAISVGLVLLFLTPLRYHYANSRAAQRLDLTLDVLERRAQPGDVVVVSPRFFVDPLQANGAKVLYLTRHLSDTEMDELSTQYERMWILYTSYIVPAELQEPLDRWVQAQGNEFALVRIKASTTLAYRGQAFGDMEAKLLDRADLLQEMAKASADEKEAWLRYNILADTYQALSELYEQQGKRELATEYQYLADEARQVVSDL